MQCGNSQVFLMCGKKRCQDTGCKKRKGVQGLRCLSPMLPTFPYARLSPKLNYCSSHKFENSQGRGNPSCARVPFPPLFLPLKFFLVHAQRKRPLRLTNFKAQTIEGNFLIFLQPTDYVEYVYQELSICYPNSRCLLL